MNTFTYVWYAGYAASLVAGLCCILSLVALEGLTVPVIEQLIKQEHRQAMRLARLKALTLRIRISLMSGAVLACMAGVASVLHMARMPAGLLSYQVSMVLGIAGLLLCMVIVPWAAALRWPVRIALLTVSFTEGCITLSWPVWRLVEVLAGQMRHDEFGVAQAGLTTGEFRSLISLVEGEGTIDHEEKALIHNVLEMDEIETHQIMTPRVDMFSLDCNMSIRQVLPQILREGYSRIPVYEEQVDKIQGVVYVKDLLPFLAENNDAAPLKEVMRPALFVTENLPANKLLQLFRDKHVHIAMVVDEYGGIQGMLTIEDVLEELVGEIYDETDTEERLIRRIAPSSYRVLGKTSMEEFNRQLHLSLKSEGLYETISGFVLYHLGRIPDEGETLDIGNLSIKIAKLEDQRIQELIVTKT